MEQLRLFANLRVVTISTSGGAFVMPMLPSEAIGKKRAYLQTMKTVLEAVSMLKILDAQNLRKMPT